MPWVREGYPGSAGEGEDMEVVGEAATERRPSGSLKKNTLM